MELQLAKRLVMVLGGLVLSGGLLIAVLVFPSPAQAVDLILSEDFEDDVLDSRISIETVGTFSSSPGIKSVTSFGSTRAFSFGRSTCRASCFDNFVTKFKISFPEPTFISSISFKEMESFDNWGSDGAIFIDGSPLTTGFRDFGRLPYNDRQADTTFRSKIFSINRDVSTIELRVSDITDLSEIFIDDLEIFGELPGVGGSVTGMSPNTGTVVCRNLTIRQRVRITIPDGATSWNCEAAGLVVNPADTINMKVNVKGPTD